MPCMNIFLLVALLSVMFAFFNTSKTMPKDDGRLQLASKPRWGGFLPTRHAGAVTVLERVPGAQNGDASQTSSPISRSWTLVPMSTTIPVQSRPRVVGRSF